MSQEETQSAQATQQHKRGGRSITVEWPDPPMEWPDYQPITHEDVQYPTLLIPTGLGRQLIYNKDDQQTFWKKVPPAWWYYPNTNVHLYGEEFRPDMGAVEFWVTFVYNMTQAGWANPITPSDPLWLINDIYQPTLDAAQRAYAMVNLGPQPQGVGIAKIYQVNSADTLDKYLTQFAEGGFKAAIIRDLHHKIGETQHVCLTDL